MTSSVIDKFPFVKGNDLEKSTFSQKSTPKEKSLFEKVNVSCKSQCYDKVNASSKSQCSNKRKRFDADKECTTSDYQHCFWSINITPGHCIRSGNNAYDVFAYGQVNMLLGLILLVKKVSY